jgi:hypothetical protein
VNDPPIPLLLTVVDHQAAPVDVRQLDAAVAALLLALDTESAPPAPTPERARPTKNQRIQKCK